MRQGAVRSWVVILVLARRLCDVLQGVWPVWGLASVWVKGVRRHGHTPRCCLPLARHKSPGWAVCALLLRPPNSAPSTCLLAHCPDRTALQHRFCCRSCTVAGRINLQYSHVCTAFTDGVPPRCAAEAGLHLDHHRAHQEALLRVCEVGASHRYPLPPTTA